MISINYRNKIIDILEEYSVEEIKETLPDYYSKIRPRIESVSEEIASLRTEKRFNGKEYEETAIEDYPEVIKELKEYYRKIIASVPALLEIREKNQKLEKEKERKEFIIKRVIPIATFVTGLGIGIAGMFF